MDPIYKTLLRKNNYYLLSNLEISHQFISVLENSKILIPTQIEKINCQISSIKKVEIFLEILPKRGSRAFDLFLEALSQSNQPYIANTLSVCLNRRVRVSESCFDFPDTVIETRRGTKIKRSMLMINISNSNIKGLERSGSAKDLADVEQFFVEELDYPLFEDHSHRDLTALEIHEIVERFSVHIGEELISQAVFLIMCHGDRYNHIVGEDDEYVEIQRILKNFSDRSIAHVLKVIVFACCRGNTDSLAVPEVGASREPGSYDDSGQVAANVVMNRTENFELSRDLGGFYPPNSIVIYSTQQNFVSYRDEDRGTVFIQALLAVLKRSARTKSVRQLVPDIRPEMRILFPQYDQMPDIKENYFADFYL